MSSYMRWLLGCMVAMFLAAAASAVRVQGVDLGVLNAFGTATFWIMAGATIGFLVMWVLRIVRAPRGGR